MGQIKHPSFPFWRSANAGEPSDGRNESSFERFARFYELANKLLMRHRRCFVSYKIPPKSTQGSKLRIVARGSGRTSPEKFQDELELVLHSFGSGVFVKPAFITLGGAGDAAVERHSLWDKFLGLAVIMAISGSFWTGVGLLITHLLR